MTEGGRQSAWLLSVGRHTVRSWRERSWRTGIRCRRWCAAHEPLAGYRIIETIYAAAGPLTDAKTPNLTRLLQLAARIAATTGAPPPPPAVTTLASRKSGAQLTAAARRLAALHTSRPVAPCTYTTGGTRASSTWQDQRGRSHAAGDESA